MWANLNVEQWQFFLDVVVFDCEHDFETAKSRQDFGIPEFECLNEKPD